LPEKIAVIYSNKYYLTRKINFSDIFYKNPFAKQKTEHQ